MDLANYYSRKDSLYSIPPRRELKLLSLLGDDLKNKEILDIGCGIGLFGHKLKKLGAKVVGLDISDNIVAKAKKYLDDAKVVDLNIKKIPFQEKKFDILIASELIEHLFQPLNALIEFNRVLKDDGFLIVSTPNLLYWGNRIKFLRGEFNYTKNGILDESHIHFYTHKALLNDLEASGFEVIKENNVYLGGLKFDFIKSYFPGIFAYQFVFKAIKKK